MIFVTLPIYIDEVLAGVIHFKSDNFVTDILEQIVHLSEIIEVTLPTDTNDIQAYYEVLISVCIQCVSRLGGQMSTLNFQCYEDVLYLDSQNMAIADPIRNKYATGDGFPELAVAPEIMDHYIVDNKSPMINLYLSTEGHDMEFDMGKFFDLRRFAKFSVGDQELHDIASLSHVGRLNAVQFLEMFQYFQHNRLTC